MMVDYAGEMTVKTSSVANMDRLSICSTVFFLFFFVVYHVCLHGMVETVEGMVGSLLLSSTSVFFFFL